MPYVLTVSLPVVYHADNDDQARLIADHVEDVLALETHLPHGAEYSDAADVTLAVWDSGELVREVFSPGSLTRYADMPEGNVPEDEDGDPCLVCANHDASYIRAEPEPEPGPPTIRFYAFCNVCCGDYLGPVDIVDTDLMYATLAAATRERRLAEDELREYPDPDAPPFELLDLKPGMVETDIRYLATADHIPPCGKCGRSITEHEPAAPNMQACRFNHPDRQSAPNIEHNVY